MNLILFAVLIGATLSLLTAQSANNTQVQPITAATPFEQLAQGQGQPSQREESPPAGPDMALLSARFNDNQFGGQIVGEVMNNGSESAEFTQALVKFRGADGAVIDLASTYANKRVIVSGDASPFNILIGSDIVENRGKTYDLTLKWQGLVHQRRAYQPTICIWGRKHWQQ